MKPIEFPEQTTVLAKDQPQYQPLPVHVDFRNCARPMTSCWELSEEEIAEVMKTGKLWIQTLTFGQPFQPVYPTVKKHEVLPIENIDVR